MVGRKGLEPLRIMPLILSQSCLPIPASAHMNNSKRGLQLIRICLLPSTTRFIVGHLTGSVTVAPHSLFFGFLLWCGWPDLNRHEPKLNRFSYYSMSPWPLSRCSLDYVFTMHFCLGGWYIVSTHLFPAILTTIRVCKSMTIRT